MNRAVECKLSKNKSVRICSAEDLIIYKTVAGKTQDLIDIEGIILRQGKKLDIKYIRRWLREFSEVLGTKEIINRFEVPWKKYLRKNRK